MRQRGFLGLFFAAMLGLLAPAVTRADLLVYATNSTASAGGTGSFEVVVQNTGSTSYNITSFNTKLYVFSGTGLTFTGADELNTDYGYIFGSVQSGALGIVDGDTIMLSDFDTNAVPPWATLGAGASLSLGNVYYSLDAGAPLDGTNPIAINFDLTQIYDDSSPNFLEIALTTQGGAVTVPVPEPGTLVLAGLVSSLGGVCVYKRRRAGVVVA